MNCSILNGDPRLRVRGSGNAFSSFYTLVCSHAILENSSRPYSRAILGVQGNTILLEGIPRSTNSQLWIPI